MLTARSILITTVAIAILALVGSLVSFLQPPDSGGLGKDTYGTRAQGYRAVFDTLEELNFDVRRALSPPNETVERATTFVLWAPQADLVQIEPVYLGKLQQWIRNGGRLIVAPQAKRDIDHDALPATRELNFVKSTTVFNELGLPEIETKVIELPPASGSSGNSGATHQPQPSSTAAQDRASDSFKGDLDRYLFPTLFPTQTMQAHADGKLAETCSGVSTLELPCSVQVLEVDPTKLAGTISVPLDAQEAREKPEANRAPASGANPGAIKWPEWWPWQTSNAHPKKPAVLAAQFKFGTGEVIVVSEPAIFDNRLFSQADNAVLAVELLGHPSQAIVWDEFYHGLTVRGNPLFLLTRSYYGLVAAMIAGLTGCWVWRQSLFLGPPLADPAVTRRTLAEYVEAMANFFHRGSDSLEYMLQELRRGVLWTLCGRFGVHGKRETPDDIAAAIARRDPAKARKLLDAVAQADLMLSPTSRVKQRDLLQAAKDLLDCL